ncbi:MAG: tripartite tricarboxylate transporter substrate binding protein [Burkholderiales bacterium]|nr:tripartite tricarboxylate transporter substrate binding protein [Burkholderiales bacterium]
MNVAAPVSRRALLAFPLVLTAGAARAVYPEQRLRLVLPFGPGSATDTLLRIVAEPLQAALGQSVVVDNKPGALTSLALADVAKAPPDGYTVVAATNSIVANPAGIQRSPGYDAMRDFAPITRIAVTSYVLVVASDKPWKNLGELLAHARAHSGKLNYASGNLGGLLYGGMFARAVGAEMTHVPYKSTPPALVDLLAGHVELMFTDLVTAAGQAKAGKLRVLLATAPQRTALFPDVPTIAESGLRGIADMPAWWSLYGPAGMPRTAIDRLNREVVAILSKPEIRARLQALGLEATPSTPEELAAFTREQSQNYLRLVKEFGIQPE